MSRFIIKQSNLEVIGMCAFKKKKTRKTSLMWKKNVGPHQHEMLLRVLWRAQFTTKRDLLEVNTKQCIKVVSFLLKCIIFVKLIIFLQVI